MNKIEERTREIEAAVSDIRNIEAAEGINRDSLQKIRDRLLALSARTDLFSEADFPPPDGKGDRKSCLYRVSEDPDHRFALYVNASLGGYGTPAHNHTTWAVITGVSGKELNRFYDRTEQGGVREKGQFSVEAGTGVAFMPDDVHSIHIDAPLLNFHMYGLALEQLHQREFYIPDENRWQVFSAHSDIREARANA